MRRIIILLITTCLLIVSIFFLLKPAKPEINLVSTSSGSPPITGTFFMNDAVFSEAQIRTIFQEQKEAGVNTVIILASGGLEKNADNSYKETVYFNAQYYEFTWQLIKIAEELGIDLYYGLTSINPSQIKFNVGDPTDLSSDQGRLIDFSLRLSDEIKTAAAKSGSSWNTIKGFYIGQEAWPAVFGGVGSVEFRYYQVLSQGLKQKHPDKKILISPTRLESTRYEHALIGYENVYRDTAIDIIAPQDNMGTGGVKTFQKSAQQYQALATAAAKYPGKQAWANVESFTTLASGKYIPTSIDFLAQQISAASPHASKIITWIYQHTMLVDPIFNNIPNAWNPEYQYTPDNASKRKVLHDAYLSYYGNTSSAQSNSTTPINMYYYHLDRHECLATSSQYSEVNSCQTNLAAYLPGQTEEVCYSTLDSCIAAHAPPASTMYYFHLSQQQCAATSAKYSDPAACQSNLANYLPGATAGVCYPTLTACQTAHPSQISNLPADFNGDGQVDLFDYNHLVDYFGNPYTIFDYNLFIDNYR